MDEPKSSAVVVSVAEVTERPGDARIGRNPGEVGGVKATVWAGGGVFDRAAGGNGGDSSGVSLIDTRFSV